MSFVRRAEREGWKPIDTAPHGPKCRVSHWSGERCDWEHIGWTNGVGHWVYEKGGLIPTHWKELEDRKGQEMSTPRDDLMAGTDWNSVKFHVELIANLITHALNSAGTPQHPFPVNGATALMCRVQIAKAMLSIGATWWNRDLSGPPVPEAHAVLMDLLTNPPIELDAEIFDVRTGEAF